MKILFTCLFAAFVLCASAQQIPNAGFEQWVPGGFFVAEFPAGWSTSSVFPAVVKSTDAHNGSYALKLRVAPYGTGVGSDRVSYAFSVPTSTVQPLYYTYWAKIHLSGTDNFETWADLTNTGSTLIVTGINYDHSYIRVADNTNVWKQMSFDMVTSGPGAYDSVTLSFAFPTQLDTASYVIIDDLAFSQIANPSGIESVSAESTIESVYPNPAQNTATVIYSINDIADVTLDIYNLVGTKVSSVVSGKQTNGRYKAEVNMENLPNGIYLVNLIVDGQIHVQKLVVQH